MYFSFVFLECEILHPALSSCVRMGDSKSFDPQAECSRNHRIFIADRRHHKAVVTDYAGFDERLLYSFAYFSLESYRIA